MDHETSTGVLLKEGHEQDALTGWPKVTRFRPGGRKAAKTTLNRRLRCQTVEIEEADQAPRALRSFSRQRALPNRPMDGQSGALGVILRRQPEVVESRAYTPDFKRS